MNKTDLSNVTIKQEHHHEITDRIARTRICLRPPDANGANGNGTRHKLIHPRHDFVDITLMKGFVLAGIHRNTGGTPRTMCFYDSKDVASCRNIERYQRWDGNQHVEWADIHRRDTALLLNAFGVPQASATRHMYVLTPDGRLVSGVYAVAAVWMALPYYRWLAKSLYALRAWRWLDRYYEKTDRQRALCRYQALERA